MTVSDTSALPLAQDTLRRAYESRRRVADYSSNKVRWYAAGNRSLAYAAAITTMIYDESLSAHVLAGSFGAEIGLVMDTARRAGHKVVAVSDQLEGQAVAYAMTEHVLIGEEIFAAASYLSKDPNLLVESVTRDALRWILIAVLLVSMLVIAFGIGSA